MEKDIDLLLVHLKNNYNIDKDDENKFKYLSKEIEMFKNKIPSIKKLEKIKKIEVELETKYEELYELGNYFDPVYIQIKNKINENKIFKIRENNRKKRKEII